MDLLIASVVVLWVLVLILAVAVFALTRQIGVLYERIAPAGALMVNETLSVGDVAPEVSVALLDGRTTTTAPVSGRAKLLFFLSPDCPICKTLLPVLKSVAASESKVDMLLVSDGETLDAHRAFVAEANLEAFDYSVSEAAGRQFGVGKLPYAVLIDSAGKISSLGLVNSREHLESLFEAQRLGVASIQAYLDADEAESDMYHNAGARK